MDERQLTDDPLQKDLDNNINFSADGRLVVFDCRGEGGINTNTRLGYLDVQTRKLTIFYTQKPPELGVGAASWIGERSVVAIHALTSGLTYEPTVRGGMIIAADGSESRRWLDSRNVIPPFTAGALRGGTHKHEPDASGIWVGFTYNDHIMKALGQDLRQVGVSMRGKSVPVPDDPQGRNFRGESFTVLLTRCVPKPRPGSDEYSRAEGDCWVGRHGYPHGSGHQRARAFRGSVVVDEDGRPAAYSDVFIVDVPNDVTVPGPDGPLEGTETTFPAPPKGTIVRRLTRTAEHHDRRLRGVSGHLRADGAGKWIACMAKALVGDQPITQVFVVSPTTGEMRRLSSIPGGVVGDPRFSPDGRYVAACASDGAVYVFSAEADRWGRAVQCTPPNAAPAHNIVISPDSGLIVYNREIGGVEQVFSCRPE
jgi:hypothetical protein